MTSLKPPLTIPQQIQKLVSKGMNITDLPIAEDFLRSNQYYRLNIYFHKMMIGPDKFAPGTTFNDIISAYMTDRKIRTNLLISLEPIEIKCRSITSHHMAIKYGSDVFYQESIYENLRYYTENYKSIKREISRNSRTPMVKHHNTNYGGKFPIWVIIELVSFNTLSKFYNNLNKNDRKAIATTGFGLSDEILSQWLHCLSVLRNICAHYGYLFQRDYSIVPTNQSLKYYPYPKNTLFPILLIIKRLSEKQSWDNLINGFNLLLQVDPNFSVSNHGFPPNWTDYI